MAWTTCPHCGQKTNGYYQKERHMRNNHPHEKEVARATTELLNAQGRLENYGRILADYRVLDAYIKAHPDMPETVLNALAKQRDNHSYLWSHRNWETSEREYEDPETELAELIASARDQVAQAEATLVTVTKVEVKP